MTISTEAVEILYTSVSRRQKPRQPAQTTEISLRCLGDQTMGHGRLALRWLHRESANQPPAVANEDCPGGREHWNAIAGISVTPPSRQPVPRRGGSVKCCPGGAGFSDSLPPLRLTAQVLPRAGRLSGCPSSHRAQPPSGCWHSRQPGSWTYPANTVRPSTAARRPCPAEAPRGPGSGAWTPLRYCRDALCAGPKRRSGGVGASPPMTQLGLAESLVSTTLSRHRGRT